MGDFSDTTEKVLLSERRVLSYLLPPYILPILVSWSFETQTKFWRDMVLERNKKLLVYVIVEIWRWLYTKRSIKWLFYSGNSTIITKCIQEIVEIWQYQDQILNKGAKSKDNTENDFHWNIFRAVKLLQRVVL